ncbi:hypothetical protein D3C78_1941910 [compost metagenome]
MGAEVAVEAVEAAAVQQAMVPGQRQQHALRAQLLQVTAVCHYLIVEWGKLVWRE